VVQYTKETDFGDETKDNLSSTLQLPHQSAPALTYDYEEVDLG
jgi:hypothetical protein